MEGIEYRFKANSQFYRDYTPSLGRNYTDFIFVGESPQDTEENAPRLAVFVASDWTVNLRVLGATEDHWQIRDSGYGISAGSNQTSDGISMNSGDYEYLFNRAFDSKTDVTTLYPTTANPPYAFGDSIENTALNTTSDGWLEKWKINKAMEEQEGTCEVQVVGKDGGETTKAIKTGINIIIVRDIICWMVKSVTAIVDRILNWTIRSFLFPAIGLSGIPGGKSVSEEVKTLPLVQDIWKINIVLADTILILVLIFVAIVNIARVSIDTYAIKKILPTLILATILAHFSILITQLIIESSEVLVVNFVPGNVDTMSQQLATAVGWITLYDAIGPALGVALFGGWIISIVFTLLPIILTLVLALMMWFRHLALYFLVAFAPIAIIMMALPVTEKIFKQWLSIFLRVTYLSTISIIFIYYAIQAGLSSLGQSAGSFLGSLAGIFGALGLLFLAIFVPISIGKGVPGLGSVFGGIGNMLKKGGGLVGKGAGKKADTMFAGATSGNTWVPGLRQMNQRLGKFAPLKAIGVGSYAGASGIGLYKGWQQNADRRWNQRIGEEAGRGEDIRELSTHLGKVLGIRAGGRKQRGDSWKQISEAANSRYNETKRTQLLTESRTMGNDQLTSDDAITRTAENAINSGNQHEAQRALLAARGRNLPNSDNLWAQYLDKFDKQGVTGPEEKRTVSVETLAFQEMLAYEAEKSGGFHEQRFGMDDKGQVIRRSDNEVTDLLVKSARKQLNNTTGKKRQQVVKNIVIHAADDETGLLGTPADRGTATKEFNATQHAMREVLTEHFPTGGIAQAAGDDLIHTKKLNTKVDIKGVEAQLFQEALDDQREGKSRRTSWNEAVEKAQGVAAGMGGGATPPPPGGTPPPPTP